MEQKNLVLVRLLEFIESKGGYSEVARKIGKHSQMFHNLIRRDAKPSLDTLEEIASQYSDFDLNYVVRGKRTVDFDTWSKMQKDYDQLKRERNIFLGAMETMGKKPKGVTSLPENVNLFRPSNPMFAAIQRGLKMAV